MIEHDIHRLTAWSSLTTTSLVATVFQLAQNPLVRVLPILPFGLLPVFTIVIGRWFEATSWRESLIAHRLRPPATVTTPDVVRWLATVSAATHPPRWSLLPLPPVCLEVVSTRDSISFYLVVSRQNAPLLISNLRATVPGTRIEEEPDFAPPRRIRSALEARLTNLARPLASARSASMNAALLHSLQPVAIGEEIRLQYIFTSAGTQRPVHTAAAGKDQWWSAYLFEGEVPSDAEAVRALRLKRQEPLLRASVRLGVTARTRARAHQLVGRVWPNLHGGNAPGVRLVRRWLPFSVVASRVRRRALPLLHWPLTVNVAELAALLALPLHGSHLPGMSAAAARQLPPPPALPTTGATVAVSDYPGMIGRPLALRGIDRLRHVWALGPTGSGKSTLLEQLALHDIRAGSGVVVVDPKNDLVNDILARVPQERVNDVIALDPSDLDRPIGLNILRAAMDVQGRELVVDNVVHIFSDVWRSSWGPRTSDVLRSALLTLIHTTAPDGSAFTLCEIAELLLNPAFRRSVLQQSTVPEAVRGFWNQYESMSAAERAAVIGPSLNKLRALTTRSSLRLMLGQSEGIDLSSVFREHKIVLVSLAKDVVGSETAQLFGALFVATLWQQCLARLRIPPARRQPVFAYLDEFADIVRLPLPLNDMLSQARGLGLSLTLANQYAGQLPEQIRAAVLSQARTQIAFQLDYDDAKLLEKRFAPLTVDDLTSFDAYGIAMRPSVRGRTLAPVTGTTLPLADPIRDTRTLTKASRERFWFPRAAVEEGLRRRVNVTGTPSGEIGRRRGAEA